LIFVLDRGTPAFEQTPPMAKMGLHSSPTGEVHVEDLGVGVDRLLAAPPRLGRAGGGRSGAKATFATDRASVAAMALGIIERCLELSLDYAKARVQFGRTNGEFQLVQLKLALMETARMYVENLVLRYVEIADAGLRPTLAEASAMKLYAARSAMEVALEAIPIFGGNGYIAENHVEQLCRDDKVLQIYGGTDEIQIVQIAKALLSR
jgi:acyl-CoA dehydrogenase